jgi:5-amino-6-(5-phosphoribosylamino)uracil reductase
MSSPRPHTTVVLAISLDGKIADETGAPARFGSPTDKRHLETQIARADAVLIGAGTLRAYGSTLAISNPALLQQRQQQDKPAQPPQIVCSASGRLNLGWRFFQQPVPRWLLTTSAGAQQWQTIAAHSRDAIASVLIAETELGELDWLHSMRLLHDRQIQQVAILGGSQLVTSLVLANLVDELWLTLCPLLLGGSMAPSLLAGSGFAEAIAPRFQLLETRAVDDEVFLHYHRLR